MPLSILLQLMLITYTSSFIITVCKCFRAIYVIQHKCIEKIQLSQYVISSCILFIYKH